MPGTSTPRCSFALKWPRKARIVANSEQRQADEDVGSVQAREAVEDRTLRVVLRGEAEVHVLVDLHGEEGEAEQEGGEQAHLHARSGCSLRAPSSAQCIVKLDESRIAVFTPATAPGARCRAPGQPVVVHDPDEEVGREERSEEHDLRDDEEQHPEQSGRRPARTRFASRRAVVLVLVPWAIAADRSGRLHSAASCADTDVLDRLAGGAPHALDQVAAQPARALPGKVEITISSGA